MIDLTPEETVRVLDWFQVYAAEHTETDGYLRPADLLIFKRLDDAVEAHYKGVVRA